MAFFRKSRFNVGTKQSPSYKWIPRAILVGKQINVKELSKRIAAESTVSETDVRAVLTALPSVMEMFMRLGRSVKLDGIGSFQYTISCQGTAVDSEDKVSARQITDVRVRFQPERTFSAGRTNMTRAMAENLSEIEWIDVDTLVSGTEGTSTTPSQGGDSGGGTNSGGENGGSGNNGGGGDNGGGSDPVPGGDE